MLIAQPIHFYRFHLSGHCHRVELMLNLLALPYEIVEINLAVGEHRSSDFLKLNLFGQVPVIDDQGVILSDSNAILVYLANRYGKDNWVPTDAVKLARVQRWLSIAAGPIAYGPAAARKITLFGAKLDATTLIAQSDSLCAILEKELIKMPYLDSEQPSIADVACYSYIACAPEGNVSLQAYPAVRAWLARIEQWPGFVPMPASKVGLMQ
ncbi:glutathione S-transferase family protein [Deefgea sp. CFH1-16]|uniref:glutathione S-transferase family protein n=1 Tax=Deefgea sp. CFH1-16 TaxID=2675457 RepID=UPI0015F5B123|nr:glutathione S-transferase [Deefgea sp. CFH1-16]MBM5573182.1 glutathione S-transferase [Deefgea sp. CFH1-16]